MAIPSGKNKWCGPWVLGALLGITTDRAEKMIQRLRGSKSPVATTTGRELELVLRQAGWSAVGCREGRISLSRWVREYDDARPHIVLAGRHWMLVTGRHVGCTVARDFLPVDRHPWRRKQVRYALAVERRAGQARLL
jgi:hypothetical protein